MTMAIESGRSGDADTAARTSFRATPAGEAATVGEATTSDNAATDASSEGMAVVITDFRTRRAPQPALRARLPP